MNTQEMRDLASLIAHEVQANAPTTCDARVFELLPERSGQFTMSLPGRGNAWPTLYVEWVRSHRPLLKIEIRDVNGESVQRFTFSAD